MDFDQKLEDLYIDLPEPMAGIGAVSSVIKVGKLLYVGDVAPYADGRLQHAGKVGIDVRLDTARLAARIAAVMMLSIVNSELGGSLKRVKRIVRLEGRLACGIDFHEHNRVLDGASELFLQILGPYGKHVRSASGVISLPGNSCLELSGIFEVK